MRRGKTPTQAPAETKKGARRTRAGAAQAASLTLTDVHQVKALADPLRIRILEELCITERTTKQVAERLGEKPTKLYHHMEALERVGLIHLVRTHQKRGTIEKYYMAVARTFRADARIFSAADASEGAAEGDTLHAMISGVFERTADEMRSLIAQNRGREGFEKEGVFAYLEIRADSKHARQIQSRLKRLLKSLEPAKQPVGKSAKTTPSDKKRYRLTLAFYRIEPDA